MINTRETDYALRILRELGDQQLHSIPSICKNQSIPQSFAYKISKSLEKDGWITTSRGVHGGLMMNQESLRKSLYDLFRVFGPIQPCSACIEEECIWKAKDDQKCRFHPVFMKIQQQIERELQRQTVRDLIIDQEENR